jgi:membrane protein DedA with SNARE-associated domain
VHNALEFLIHHSAAVLFAAVLANQMGVPVPATPFLIAVGALARTGEASPAVAIALALAAAFIAHSVWYEAGRRGGRRILKLVCRIAIEPDACVRRTENTFARYGLKSLLIAPFVPGLGVVSHPLSGMIGVPYARFILFSTGGIGIWAATLIGVGYLFGHQLEDLLEGSAGAAGKLATLVALAIAGYLAWKLVQRQRFLRSLRMARIGPEELRLKLGAGDSITVVDLRHPQDIELEPRMIPGALRILPEELELRHGEIPRGGEIVLYCT